jgi:hypothetical protein
MAEVISPVEAMARFTACSICIGYCHDSGRSQIADEIQKDLEALVLLMGEDRVLRLNRLWELLRAASSPWVKFHAAVFLYKNGSKEALAVLEEIAREGGGLCAPSAWLWLMQARDGKV